MILTATIRDDSGNALGVVVLDAKQFASGKVGFFGQAKLVINGERYQVQAQAVKIAAKEKERTAVEEQN